MFTILGADGKEYGPVTAGKIHEWILDGRANLQTQARKAGDTAWKPLGEFADFQQTTARDSEPPLLDQVPASQSAATTDAAEVVSPASPWLRLPAAAIDGFLKLLGSLPVMLPLVRLIVSESLSGEQRTFQELSELTSDVVNTHLNEALPLLGLLVLVQFLLLAWRGQSIGKLLLGLRIVRHNDGGPAGPVRAFLLRGTLPFMIEQIPFAGFAFWIVDCCFIFRSDRRCLHDLVAGTVVIRK